MTHAIIFDSLQYANQLKSVGIPDKQAEMQAVLEKKQIDSINEFIDASIVTKQDIELCKNELKAEMKLLTTQMAYKTIIILGSVLGGMTIIGFTILSFLIQIQR